MTKKAKRRRLIIKAVDLLIGFLILCIITRVAAAIVSYALIRIGAA